MHLKWYLLSCSSQFKIQTLERDGESAVERVCLVQLRLHAKLWPGGECITRIRVENTSGCLKRSSYVDLLATQHLYLTWGNCTYVVSPGCSGRVSWHLLAASEALSGRAGWSRPGSLGHIPFSCHSFITTFQSPASKWSGTYNPCSQHMYISVRKRREGKI